MSAVPLPGVGRATLRAVICDMDGLLLDSERLDRRLRQVVARQVKQQGRDNSLPRLAANRFDAIMCGDEVPRGKLPPDVYIYAPQDLSTWTRRTALHWRTP